MHCNRVCPSIKKRTQYLYTAEIKVDRSHPLDLYQTNARGCVIFKSMNLLMYSEGVFPYKKQWRIMRWEDISASFRFAPLATDCRMRIIKTRWQIIYLVRSLNLLYEVLLSISESTKKILSFSYHHHQSPRINALLASGLRSVTITPSSFGFRSPSLELEYYPI